MKIIKISALVLAALAVAAISFEGCQKGGKISALTVSPANPVIANGASVQFTTGATFSDGSVIPWTMVIWSSSNTGVATISNAAGSMGLASSGAAGTTTIYATGIGHPDIIGTATLTVTNTPLVTIRVTPANSVTAKGTTRQLTATGTFADGTTMNLTSSVIWSSSNADVASVSNAAGSIGLATSTAVGSITIIAVDPTANISASTTLTVI